MLTLDDLVALWSPALRRTAGAIGGQLGFHA